MRTLIARKDGTRPFQKSYGATLRYRNNRVSNPCSRTRLSEFILVNSTPIPSPGTMFRTTACAKTMPPGTSKTRVRSAPTRSVMDPQRDRPPMLNVLTRETCCWPPPFQVTDMPLGSAIRWWRRVSQRVSVAIRHGKGTSSIGREPIVQTFLSGSTLESQSVLQHSRSAEPLERPEGIESESLSLQDAGPVRIVIKGGRPRALDATASWSAAGQSEAKSRPPFAQNKIAKGRPRGAVSAF